jgi:hypothetical protein
MWSHEQFGHGQEDEAEHEEELLHSNEKDELDHQHPH